MSDPVTDAKRAALEHLQSTKKPNAESSFTDWKNYIELLGKLEIKDETPPEDVLLEQVTAMIGRLEKWIEAEYKREIDLLLEENEQLKQTIEGMKNGDVSSTQDD